VTFWGEREGKKKKEERFAFLETDRNLTFSRSSGAVTTKRSKGDEIRKSRQASLLYVL
jgi:hypothetical protein